MLQSQIQLLPRNGEASAESSRLPPPDFLKIVGVIINVEMEIVAVWWQ